MLFKFSSSLWLFLLCGIIWADTLIIEPDMGRAPIFKAIDASEKKVDLIMYGFTDQSLLRKILEQKKRGKDVRVILENKPYAAHGENLKVIHTFKQNQIEWHGLIPPYHLIHQKSLLLDDKKVLVFTFNFTHSAFKQQRNFGLIIDDPKTTKKIISLFNADWHGQVSDVQDENLLVSPTTSRQILIKHFQTSKHSIKIYAQHINDYQIIGELAKAAKRGVHVEILISAELRKKQARYLAKAGVHILKSKKYIIHAKTIIIDNEKAILGSINLTRSSLDVNRELSVVSYDPQVIAQLNRIFDYDKSSKK